MRCGVGKGGSRMSWLDGPLVAWDLESTGVDPNSARIVTATVVWLTPASPRWEVKTKTWLADPGVEIPAGAAKVHGITTARARAEGRPAWEVVAEVTTALGRALAQQIPVVGHNIGGYDLTLLDREGRRHGTKTLSEGLREVSPIIDTLTIDRAFDRYRKGKRTLTATAKHYGIELSEDDAHDATADAMASVRVLWKMAQAYPTLRQVPLASLHHQQIGWRAEQAASLESYLRKKDPTATVNPAWPIQPLPDGWDPSYHPDDDQPAAASTPPLTGSPA